MANLLTNLFGNPGNHAQTSAKTQSNAYPPFTRLAQSGRIISEYSGVLPATRLTARHILRCEHLRDIPGEGLPPYRVEPQFTHQIWLWCRPHATPDQLSLIFRGQFEFVLPGKDPDWVAAEVTDFLAYLLLQATDPNLVMRHDESDLFWAEAIETQLESLL